MMRRFSTAVLLACLALAIHVEPIARAGAPASLDDILARISDEAQSAESRHRAFLELLFGIDALVNASPDEKQPLLSHCSAFAFLFSTLYQLNGSKLEPTLKEAPLFVGTSPIIFGTMISDSGMLFGPLAPIREQLVGLLTSSYNRGSGQNLTQSELVAKVEKEQNPSAQFHNVDTLRAFQLAAVARLSGLAVDHVDLPLWLTSHSGVGLTDNVDPSLDRQGRRWGYLQLPDDDDATGRHDHLIGTMMLGYSAERARADALAISDSGAVSCTADPYEQTPGFQGRFMRTLSWAQAGARAAFGTVRPANWLYTALRSTAPYAEEYLSPDQNSSHTDATVNSRGQQLGAQLTHPNHAVSPAAFNTSVYNAICDEGAISPHVHGPASADAIRADFDRIAGSVKLPW